MHSLAQVAWKDYTKKKKKVSSVSAYKIWKKGDIPSWEIILIYANVEKK